MLKENRKTLLITSILTVLPVLIGVVFWNRLPEEMATHFGMDGGANGYSSKVFAVFGLPLFCLAMHWLAAFMTAQDPKKQNIGSKLFSFILWIVPAVSLFCAGIIYPFNLGYQMDITRISEILIGVMFIALGNYLPKVGQNYTIGIRLPWTLDDEENWNRTHRAAGRLWVGGGIVILLLVLSGMASAYWMAGIFLILTLVPVVYSFRLYKKGAGGAR